MYKETKKIFVTSIIAILASVLVYTICFLKNKTTSDLPAVCVSIRVREIRKDSIALTWIVQNYSEQLLTFDNNIMQVKLNGQDVLYPTKAVTLEPDEKISIDLDLEDVDVNKSNRVQITASSNEGTTATFCKTIRNSSK